MRKIQELMLALYGNAKNLHYSRSGKNYYGIHKLADKIIKDVDPLGTIDHINEYNLGVGKEPVDFQELFDERLYVEADFLKSLKAIQFILKTLSNHIEEMEFDTRAIESYLTGVQDNVIFALGFVNRTLQNNCKDDV